MERKNKFFGLGKTLAAGALALAMVPGSALAMASYSAEAYVDVFVIADQGLLLDIDIDFDYEAGIPPTGNAVVTDETSFVSIEPINDTSSFTAQDASVAGSASPAGGGSTSSALAENGLTFTAFNPTDAPLNVLFEFVLGAGVTISTTDPTEFVGGIASILIGEVLSGVEYAYGFDEVGNFQGSLFDDTLSIGLTIDPGSFDGLFVEVVADGIAVSGSSVVPVPATLALLGIGLIGFTSRRRFLAARG